MESQKADHGLSDFEGLFAQSSRGELDESPSGNLTGEQSSEKFTFIPRGQGNVKRTIPFLMDFVSASVPFIIIS